MRWRGKYKVIKSFLLTLVLFFSVCPNGIVNMTGSTTGTLVYPSSGNYGINETKCWRIEVPKPYVGIGIYFHRYSCLLSVEVSSFLTYIKHHIIGATENIA